MISELGRKGAVFHSRITMPGIFSLHFVTLNEDPTQARHKWTVIAPIQGAS